MASLRQIVRDYAPVLLLDAAASSVQVGWFGSKEIEAAQWRSAAGEAGTELFRGIESLNADLSQSNAFIFCEAPGSVLGIRTSAMAIRTWCVLKPRPVFAYNALAVMAESESGLDLQWIADARRDSWHALVRGGKLQRIPTAELRGGPFATPAEFRRWSELPAGVRQYPYDLPRRLNVAADTDLFQPTDAPESFLHSEPSYLTWEPKVHAAQGRFEK